MIMIVMMMIRMMMIRRMMMMIIIIMIIMITYWKPTRTTVIHSHDDYDDENPHPAKLQWPFTGLPARSQLEVTKLLQTPRSWWFDSFAQVKILVLQFCNSFFETQEDSGFWLRDRIAGFWLLGNQHKSSLMDTPISAGGGSLLYLTVQDDQLGSPRPPGPVPGFGNHHLSWPPFKNTVWWPHSFSWKAALPN